MADHGQKPARIDTSHTVFADKSEIALKESDNRFTSPDFVRAIVDGFGEIDFDPCWHPASAVKPKAYLNVRRGDDGLSDDWSGQLAFVNPPWSAQDKWLKKGYQEWTKGNVGTLIFLVPAKTDSRFFHEVLSHEADIFLIKGRPHFFQVDGKSEATMNATMLVVFGASNQQKSRIASLLEGAWWSPSQLPTHRIEGAFTNWREMVGTPVSFSCVAQQGSSSAFSGLSCKPFVGLA